MFRFKWFLASALAVGAAGLTYSASEVANAAEAQEVVINGDDAEDGFDAAADKGTAGDKGKGGKKGKKGKKGGKKKGGKKKGKGKTEE